MEAAAPPLGFGESNQSKSSLFLSSFFETDMRLLPRLFIFVETEEKEDLVFALIVPISRPLEKRPRNEPPLEPTSC